MRSSSRGWSGWMRPSLGGVVAADPTTSGWTLIARVNSDAYFGLTGTARPPQQASSISSARGTLGKYRHLLMIVQPTTGIDDDGTQQNFGTFFGEIDVYAAP